MLSSLKILDRYIIRKFLSTFFFAIGLIIAISIVFDISEKLDDFLDKKAPLGEIIFDYYLNFIPYFANLFSPLFIFISVIFFTGRMAANTEIIVILNSGISFKRFLQPYLITAIFLSVASYFLGAYVIPQSNETRLEFENRYIKNPYVLKTRNIHRQISPGEYIYFENYNTIDKVGYLFSLEKFDAGRMKYKMLAERIVWDTISSKWTIENYYIREIENEKEKLTYGPRLDTILSFYPEDFSKRINHIQSMSNPELKDHINEEKMRGSGTTVFAEIELYKRTSYPFATIILTLIGVALSSRKVRGGIGLQIGMGILLSFTYIMFMQVSSTFATNGTTPAIVAVWIPNIVFLLIALYLVRKAPA